MIRSLSLTLFAVMIASPPACAQRPPGEGPDAAIDAATRAQVIEHALEALDKRYVFPKIAAAMATQIRGNVKARRYDKITSAKELADRLTADLREVSKDKHLAIWYSPDVILDADPDAPPTTAEVTEMREGARLRNAGFVKVERLDGNIGYVDFRFFAPPDIAGGPAAAAMSFLADSDALIVDLRQNGGGDPATVALMVSYLLPADEDVHINDVYWWSEPAT